ncbi:MAG: TIGR03960 family B12-binding radical SAM protein [Deltaproteobacteria bacterium]|nr:TIGR03960 family B12-binding radical SAM protein [Deltaproteobacteria bacterium]
MIESPYSSFLHKVEKPGRYVGGEFGSIMPKDNHLADIVLAFPDSYEIGMSHMGFSILYEIINKTDSLNAERCYMPWPDMFQMLKDKKIPLLSLESMRPIKEFDFIGFSLQYELSYTNIINMLDLAQVPRRSVNRDQTHPVIIAGGPVAAACEPISPFIDLLILGDGEESLAEVMNLYGQRKNEGKLRYEIIKELSLLPYVFAPSLVNRIDDKYSEKIVIDTSTPLVQPAFIKNLEDYPTGNGPVSQVKAVFDRYSVEIARGCTEGCRFCQAGYLYRPVRERTRESIEKALEKATDYLGFDEVSLSALSSADHSKIEEIVTITGAEYLNKRVSFSVPSLRAYGLKESVIDVLSKLRATGVTLAPEAGSQRLRDVINKNITEDDLVNAATKFFEKGFFRIKLYFMLGLPSETDDDLLDIIQLALLLRSTGRRLVGKKAEIVVSVSTFVPKPFTPFEREQMIEGDEIRRRQNILYAEARKHKLILKTHNVKMSVMEGIFSRGDAALADSIEKAVDLGANFDGWDDRFDQSIWDEALKDVDISKYFKKVPDAARLPWDFVQNGVTAAYRLKERDKALLALTTQPCGVYKTKEENEFICTACGVKCKPDELPVRPKILNTDNYVNNETDISDNRVIKRDKNPQKVIQAGSSAVHFRMEVAFYGRQTYLGHLDTMNHLLRSFRRAGLNLWYTEGFHPKPKIEAPPPVPLGTAALKEPFDVWLVNPPSEEEILKKLKTALPMDLEINAIRKVNGKAERIAVVYNCVQYVVFIKENKDIVDFAINKIKTEDKIIVKRVKKNQSKEVDIKQYVVDIKTVDIDPESLKLPILDTKERTALEITLKITDQGGTKPKELLESVFDYPLDNLWIVRTKWLKL